MQISSSYLDYIWCKTTRWIFNVGNVTDASFSFFHSKLGWILHWYIFYCRFQKSLFLDITKAIYRYTCKCLLWYYWYKSINLSHLKNAISSIWCLPSYFGITDLKNMLNVHFMFWKQVNWGILQLYNSKVFCQVTRFEVTFALKICPCEKNH